MNPNIEKLYNLGKKPFRLIVGLMSGTSLDGLDIALCKFSGSGSDSEFEILNFETIPYSSSFQEQIRLVFAKNEVEQKHISGLNVVIANNHASALLQTLKKWNISADQIDLIASHGQTIFHAPQSISDKFYPNNTFQIGDGDHLAVKTGIITMSDFRQKHVAAGGEGAPLVLYGDYFLFQDSIEDRILLNLGGISNFTYLPSQSSLQQGDEIWATDLGPANTLINQFMQEKFNLEMDRDGEIAQRGIIHQNLLEQLMNHAFFDLALPKTTGPEMFNLQYLNQAIERTGQAFIDEDIVATLTAFSVECVNKGLQVLKKKAVLYVSGGGVHNPVMMNSLKEANPTIQIKDFSVLDIIPDAKEALLFAALANENIMGNRESLKALKQVPQVFFGKISFPN